ncbi:hypothetical protein [Phytoactinopolyspora endophytica]|uniref:hypothetical protein n=1 Tax=Phytoactinopolyspora endophytica TaxID=1642495 RepID=UPI003B8362B2
MSTGGVQTALELTELGAQLRAQRYRREHSDASESEVRGVVADWLADRSKAPDGDAQGRLVTWPRTA